MALTTNAGNQHGISRFSEIQTTFTKINIHLTAGSQNNNSCAFHTISNIIINDLTVTLIGNTN